jgi:ribosome-associated protein
MHWWMQLSPDKYAFELVNGSENSMKELYLCNFENAKYLKNLQEKTAQQEKHLSTTQITELIVDSIQDIKGKNIVSLDLRELDDAPTDYFIICEGDSSTQISAIANNIVKRLKEEAGLRPSHVEGKQSGTWVLVDYFDVIVHVFYPETRRFYEIEELWSDAKQTEYQNI